MMLQLYSQTGEVPQLEAILNAMRMPETALELSGWKMKLQDASAWIYKSYLIFDPI